MECVCGIITFKDLDKLALQNYPLHSKIVTLLAAASIDKLRGQVTLHNIIIH
jgi:hypothetical protein